MPFNVKVLLKQEHQLEIPTSEYEESFPQSPCAFRGQDHGSRLTTSSRAPSQPGHRYSKGRFLPCLPVFPISNLNQILLVLKLDHMKHTAKYIRGEIEPPVFIG